MRIGILGGTFNPIHNAHLILAKTVAQAIGLDKILFIPAFIPPHKLGEDILAYAHRERMVELAVEGHDLFECSDIEASLEGPSYTINTLRLLRQSQPNDDFFLIIGSDSLHSLGNWKDPDEIVKLATLAVVPRPGYRIEESEPRFRKNLRPVDMDLVEIASSEIRERAAQGKPVQLLVPAAVANYIVAERLYQS